MGGPGNLSSDILGIEVGQRVVRGVRLDQETTELTAAAECSLDQHAVSPQGVIDAVTVGPALDQVIDRLGVQDRTGVRVGLTIGPHNAGVGSGPTMTPWLEAQAVNLREPMICSGGLGISFVPTRAVDAALKLASGSGIDLVRIDLAPVAAARAIGDQVEDVICIGSGRGWQARMRDFEVLEAMENVEIGDDDPLSIVAAHGPARSISRYGWVEVSAELDQARRLDIGQLAPAVGAAIGVVYESPANLLLGKEVTCEQAALKPAPGYGLDPADYEIDSPVGEPTLQLGSKVSIDDDVGSLDSPEDGAGPRRGLTAVPDDWPVAAPAPERIPAPERVPAPERISAPAPERVSAPERISRPERISAPAAERVSAPAPERISGPERISAPAPERISAPAPERISGPVPAPERIAASVPEPSSAAAPDPDPERPEPERPEHVRRIAPPRTSLSPLAAIKERAAADDRAEPAERSRPVGDPWSDSLDESDPITMFSPDTEVRHMMGKRDTRFNLDVVFVVLLISAVALLVVYRFL